MTTSWLLKDSHNLVLCLNKLEGIQEMLFIILEIRQLNSPSGKKNRLIFCLLKLIKVPKYNLLILCQTGCYFNSESVVVMPEQLVINLFYNLQILDYRCFVLFCIPNDNGTEQVLNILHMYYNNNLTITYSQLSIKGIIGKCTT